MTEFRRLTSIVSLSAISILLLDACQQSMPDAPLITPSSIAVPLVATQDTHSLSATLTPEATLQDEVRFNEIPPLIVEAAKTTDVPTTAAPATVTPVTAVPATVKTPAPQNVAVGTVGQAVRLMMGPYRDRAPAGRITTAITLTWNSDSNGKGNSDVDGKGNGKDNENRNGTGALIVTYAENQLQQRTVLTIEGNRLAVAQEEERKSSEGLDKTWMYMIGDNYYSVYQPAAGQKQTCTILTRDQARRVLPPMRPDAILDLLSDANGVRGVIKKTTQAGNTSVESIKLDRGVGSNSTKGTKSNETPVLIEGVALIAHRHFTEGEPVVTPPADGRDFIYLQHLDAVYEGTPKILNVTGRITVTYDFALPESGVDITLPAACQNPTNS